jgi:hypothetical protein
MSLSGRVAHDADAARVGDENRSLDQPALIHPVCAGHVAITVARKVSGEHGVAIVLSPWKDGRDSGAYRPFADDQLALSRDQRLESNFNSRHVSDGIHRPRGPVERHAQIARPRLRGILSMDAHGKGKDTKQARDCQSARGFHLNRNHKPLGCEHQFIGS